MSTTAAPMPADDKTKGAQRTARAPRPLRTLRARNSPRIPRPRQEIRPGETGETWDIASSTAAVIALVCAWMLLQLLVLGGLAHERGQHLLYSQFRSELAQATVPTAELDYNGNPIQPGAPVALLTIPGISLHEVVVDGTASGDLLAGPGHLRDTPLPGQAGTSVVMGRGSTYGAPFADIARLHAGDTITVLNGQGTVAYQVQDVRRAGDAIPAAPTGPTAGRLTLISAQSSGFLSALRPHAAVYVDATTDKALPDGPVAAAVPSSEKVMASDTTALPTLVLLLAGLAAVVLGVSITRRRFRLALVWLVATPVVIALAWSVTDQVMRLLPNLM